MQSIETKRRKEKMAEPIPPKALQVVMVVADIYGVPVDKILGNCRKNEVKVARHVAMNRLFDMGDHRRKNTIVSKRNIGKWFGGKDHSTVINAILNVQSWTKTYEDMRIQYDTLVRATNHINLYGPVKYTLEERIQRLPEQDKLAIKSYIEKIEKQNEDNADRLVENRNKAASTNV